MRTVLFITTLLISTFLSGHNPSEMQGRHYPKRFKVGDMYYTSSFRGLNLFMNELKTDDPDLFEIINPEFARLKRKRNSSLIAAGSSGLIGTAMIVGGFTFLKVKDDFYKPGQPFYKPDATKENNVLIFSGLGVYIIGGFIGALLQPNEEDIYNFVNLFNRNSPNQKMDWQLGFDYHNMGLKLTLNL
jgi:hypothetical protein